MQIKPEFKMSDPMKRIKMTWLICGIVALVVGYFGWSTSRAAYESAKYRVIEADQAFEIREYPQLKLVSTPMSFGSQGNDGSFMRLFQFISGANAKQQKVSMTTPVFMNPEREDSTGQMAFVIPSQVANEGVPEPSNKNVEIREREPGFFAVSRFAGKISEQSIREQESRLRQWLAAKGHDVDGELEVAGYDPPWMPGPLRRNEVLVRIQPQAAAFNSETTLSQP